jgi:hypothetical protein
MENELVWIAYFGANGHYDHAASPPFIGTAVVIKRTAKTVTVEPCKASGYIVRIDAERCFATREELVEYIRPRCIQLAERHEDIAAKFRAAVNPQIPFG